MITIADGPISGRAQCPFSLRSTALTLNQQRCVSSRDGVSASSRMEEANVPRDWSERARGLVRGVLVVRFWRRSTARARTQTPLFLLSETGWHHSPPHPTTSVSTAAIFVYTSGAGITAGAGTRLILQWVIIAGFEWHPLLNKAHPVDGPCCHSSSLPRHAVSPLGNLRACCRP